MSSKQDKANPPPGQLGFGFDEMLEEQRTAYLPSTMEEAIPFYRKLLERHHGATMAGDGEQMMALRKEAHDLAVKLNGGQPGIPADKDSPGHALSRETAAPDGAVPLWGQKGSFIIDFRSIPIRIEQDGVLGIGAYGSIIGFAAHAVDYGRPFISETGFRSFLGVHGNLPPGMTPDMIAAEVIKAHVDRELKGKLQKIERSYVEREMERRNNDQRANER